MPKRSQVAFAVVIFGFVLVLMGATTVAPVGSYGKTSPSQIDDFTPSLVPAGPPVASNDYYVTDEDVVLHIDTANGILANDTDPNDDPLTATLVSEPLHGSLVLETDGSFTYTPESNWFGEDSFDYEVSDGDLTDTATVFITVLSVNDAPVALDDAYTTDQGFALEIDAPGILTNDSDVDSEIQQAILVSLPNHGKVTLYSNGSFVYIPEMNWSGVDNFTYVASDGSKESNIAVVTITVLSNDPPVTSIFFTGDEGEYGWYHSDVTVTLTATDDYPGVEATYYSLDGSTWVTYSGPFVLSESGEYTIFFYSTDTGGNVEDIKNATIKIGKATWDFVTGGGSITTSGGRGHFAFVVRYRWGDFRGIFLYTFRSDHYRYFIVSNDFYGMAIDGDYALIEGEANIFRYDYNNRDWKYFRGTFRVELWDKGRHHDDIFQVTISDNEGELVHRAGFDPGDKMRGSIRIHHRAPRHRHRYRRRRWGS